MKPFGLARFAASRVARPALLIAISLLLLVMLVACGKKGPVRPKLESPPEAPAELTLRQQGNLFVLGWTIPSASRLVRSADDLTGFRIRRLSYDAAQGCPTCRDPRDVVAEIDIKHPDPGQRFGERMYWRDLEITPGNGYRYAIVAVALGGQEGVTAAIHLAVQQPPPPPTGLHLEAGDARVALQWTAPVLPENMQLVGYNLYRGQAERAFPIVPLNPEPLQATQLVDRGLDNGRVYEYRVSALVRAGEQLLESEATNAALVTPQQGR